MIETGPAVAGAIYGGRLGALAAPFMGPAAPIAPFAGAGVGFMAGVLAGKPLSELVMEAPESKDLVPYFEGGKTFGSTIAFAPAAFGIPAALGTRIGPYISRIGEFARKSPKSYLLGELSAGASSSVGTVLAEEYAPGQAGTRFAAELVFGALNPVRYLPTLTAWSGKQLRTLWKMRTKEGREGIAAANDSRAQDMATQRLMEILERDGEDIPALIKALEQPLPGGPRVSYPTTGAVTGPSAAQKTGSETLSKLEAALGILDPSFGASLNDQGRESLRAYSLVINAMNDAGSPEALRAAAQMREKFFTDAINGRLERANLRAAERIAKIKRDTPEARVEIGLIVREEVEKALENARAAERFYWERADREASKPAGQTTLMVQPSETLVNKLYTDWAGTVLPELKRMQRNDVDFRNPAAVSRLLKKKAVPLSVFIKETGGIANDAELAARDITNKSLPGLVRQNISRNVRGERGTASIDAVRERVFDAGYFPQKGSYNEISDSELYDAIERDLNGDERVWTINVRAALDPYVNEREVLDSWAAEGFDPSMTLDQVANRARVLDDLRRKEGREGFYVSPDKMPGPTKKTVPRPRQLTAENTVRAYLERVSQIGPALVDSMVPADVRRIMESFGVNDTAVEKYRRGRTSEQFSKTGIVHHSYLPDKRVLEKIKAGDLINYRSNLLTLARQARGRGDVADASFYSYLAESMLTDLSKLDNPAYDKAREFSSSLNDVFTRTFANDLLSQADTGAPKYPAETLIQRAFGVGGDLTALRMREIENAVGFMRERLRKAAEEAPAVIPGDTRFEDEAKMLREFASVSTRGVASIQDAQNRIMRLLASKATFVDPKTNGIRLNTRRLNEFVAQNKTLLDQLGITGDLTDAVQAENALRAVLEQNSALNTTVRKQMAFSRVLATENPTMAIASALRSRFPMRSMAQLARLAQRDGPDAMAGLKASLYDYIFTKASGGTEVIDPQRLQDALFKPFAKGQPALADIMRTQGLVTPQELGNIRTFTERMMRIEDAMGGGRVALDNVVTGADALSELAMRVVGARIGASASGGGGPTLIAASAGSKTVRQVFDKMPMMMVRKTMQRAVQDPMFMAMLLRRTPSEREKFTLAKSMHAYMLASGLTYATYEEPPEARMPEQAPADQGPRASDQLRDLTDLYDRMRGRPQPPAPNTRGMPGKAPAAPQGAPTGGAPAAPAGGMTQSRAMMQQLFPNDAILGAAATMQNPAM
jgi:hypothetical protein